MRSRKQVRKLFHPLLLTSHSLLSQGLDEPADHLIDQLHLTPDRFEIGISDVP